MFFSKKYDVFISYAIEDKFTVAEIIASKLKKNGIKVWYGGSELKVGDPISTVINSGLRNSNYCILILSPFYIRHWTIVELYSFIEKEQLEKKILILPIWHNLDYKEAKEKYPIIADRFAMSTQNGLDEVSSELCKVIWQKKKSDSVNRVKRFSIALLFFIACITSIFFIYRNYSPTKSRLPSKQIVQTAIEKRTAEFQSELENNFQKKCAIANGKKVSLDSISNAYTRFVNFTKYDRNEYRFTGQSTVVSGSRNVQDLGISISGTPYNRYGMTNTSNYLLEHCCKLRPDTTFNYSFTLLNDLPLTFVVDTIFESEGKIHAFVTYSQNIRSVEGILSYPLKKSRVRKQLIQFTGYKPTEEYIFEIKNGIWIINEVK
jgi:hypothetical protein